MTPIVLLPRLDPYTPLPSCYEGYYKIKQPQLYLTNTITPHPSPKIGASSLRHQMHAQNFSLNTSAILHVFVWIS